MHRIVHSVTNTTCMEYYNYMLKGMLKYVRCIYLTRIIALLKLIQQIRLN